MAAFDARDLPLPDGGRRVRPLGTGQGMGGRAGRRHLAGLDEHDFVLNAGGDIVLRAAPTRCRGGSASRIPCAPGRILSVLDLPPRRR